MMARKVRQANSGAAMVSQGAVVDAAALRGALAASGTPLERRALLVIEQAGLMPPEREYRGIRGRLFRFDLAWPDAKVAVEIQGGTWSPQRMGHSSGSGIERDQAKANEAQLQGWIVLAYSDHGINDGSMVEDVRRALEIRRGSST